MTELGDHALVCREAPGLLEDSKCASPWPGAGRPLGSQVHLVLGRGEGESVHRRVTFQRLQFKGGLGSRRWLAKPNSAVADALGRTASGEEKNKKGGAPISRRTFSRRGQGSPPPERSEGPDSVTTRQRL